MENNNFVLILSSQYNEFKDFLKDSHVFDAKDNR